MSWVLVIYIYAGNSVTLTSVPMSTQELCESAGQELDPLVSDTTKVVRYVCLKNQ